MPASVTSDDLLVLASTILGELPQRRFTAALPVKAADFEQGRS
jgi:hypothetical protein